MAKRSSDLDSIFKKTTPVKNPQEETELVPATGRTLPTGVGLKESEVAMLDEIVDELGVSRNALMRYAIRHFLIQYQTGEISLEEDVERPEPKAKLNMP